MVYERRDNSGVLFRNDRKNNPKAPDYTGNAEVDGTEYRLSAWIKEGQRGKFMSLSFQLKGDNNQRPARRRDDDEDIPF